MELVPIKVKIGLRENGHADHPDWMQLPLAATEKPASHMHGGWQYDQTSGHAEETADSPRGMQWGMVLVTDKFANEAVAKFPTLVTILTETEAEAFWNNKAHVEMPQNSISVEVLQGLKAERDLRVAVSLTTTEIDARILKALDPADTTTGIRKDNLKLWSDAKTTLGITIKK